MTSYNTMQLLILLAGAYVVNCANPVVEIPNGKLQGLERVTMNNKTFYSFQRIPFAKPPLGDLRFEAPQEPDTWDDVRDATSNDVMCVQISGDLQPYESEDCLFVNVFTPTLPENGTKTELLPVMFYIYGGGFVGGNSYYNGLGPEFFIDYDVIIVTINYRIASFGFLSTEDLNIPGNYGLKDQQQALRWVQKNIKYFGGDANRVTIFGESAGSASVGYQLLSKGSAGLFHAAIMESGSPLSAWAYQRNATQIAYQTAKNINADIDIKTTTPKELLNFLRNVSTADLKKSTTQIAAQENPAYLQILQGFFFAPIVEKEHDTAFITQTMYEQFKSGNNVNKVPTMIGFNSEESLGVAADLNYLHTILRAFDDNTSLLTPRDMHLTDANKIQEVGDKIRELYVGDGKLDDNLVKGVRYMSDQSFNKGVITQADFQSNYTDVYFYEFSYEGPLGARNTTALNGSTDTVEHTEEMQYLWRCTYSDFDNTDLSKFPEKDVLTHERLITLWTNFAKYLNPTPEETVLFQNVTWPTVTFGSGGNITYLDIGEDLTVRTGPKQDTYFTWVQLYDTYGIPPFDSY